MTCGLTGPPSVLTDAVKCNAILLPTSRHTIYISMLSTTPQMTLDEM